MWNYLAPHFYVNVEGPGEDIPETGQLKCMDCDCASASPKAHGALWLKSQPFIYQLIIHVKARAYKSATAANPQQETCFKLKFYMMHQIHVQLVHLLQCM